MNLHEANAAWDSFSSQLVVLSRGLFAVSRTQPRAVRRDSEVLFGKFSPRGSRLFNAGRRRSAFGVLCRDCLRALQGDLP